MDKTPECVRTSDSGPIVRQRERYLDSLSRLFGQTNRQTFAFHLVANANFCGRMISAYSADALATRIKIKIEPSRTERVRAALVCLKAPIVFVVFTVVMVT